MRPGEPSWPPWVEMMAAVGGDRGPPVAAGELSGGADGPVSVELEQVVRGCD